MTILLYAAAVVVAAAVGVTVFVILALMGSRKIRSEQDAQAAAMTAMRAAEWTGEALAVRVRHREPANCPQARKQQKARA